MRVEAPQPGSRSWLLQLSPQLEEAEYSLEDAIGVAAHELAHAVLGHLSDVQPTDDKYNQEHSAMLMREVESWQQVVDWGICATAQQSLKRAQKEASLGGLVDEVHDREKNARP